MTQYKPILPKPSAGQPSFISLPILPKRPKPPKPKPAQPSVQLLPILAIQTPIAAQPSFQISPNPPPADPLAYQQCLLCHNSFYSSEEVLAHIKNKLCTGDNLANVYGRGKNKIQEPIGSLQPSLKNKIKETPQRYYTKVGPDKGVRCTHCRALFSSM